MDKYSQALQYFMGKLEQDSKYADPKLRRAFKVHLERVFDALLAIENNDVDEQEKILACLRDGCTDDFDIGGEA